MERTNVIGNDRFFEFLDKKIRLIFLRFTIVYYFFIAISIYFRYMFNETQLPLAVVCLMATIGIGLMQIGAYFTMKREQHYEIFTIGVGALFFTLANITMEGNEVLILFIPFCILGMLVANKDMNYVLYVIWAGNAIIRLILLIVRTDTTNSQYRDFVWIFFECIICMIAIDFVHKLVDVYYSSVIHSLCTENKKKQRLYEQSKVDSTTELLNRNAYNEYLEAFDTKMQSVCCIYIDVNGLHEYNNAYGHQAGDEMLMIVADEMKRCFRSSRQYRVGGDEFVVICENASFKEVAMELKSFRMQMKERKIHVATGMEWRDDNIEIDDIIKAADTKMYQDKEQFYKSHRDDRTAANLYAKKVR